MPKNTSPTCLPWTIYLFKDSHNGTRSVHPFSSIVKQEATLRAVFCTPRRYPATTNKHDLPCWTPAVYSPGARRANKNVLGITTLILDYDDPEWSPSRMSEHLCKLDIAHAVHTTWGHKPEDPRYRVFVFLSRALTGQEFPQVRDHLIEQIGYTEGLDDLTDLSRHYICPAQRSGVQYEGYLEASRPLLCVDSVMNSLVEAEKAQGLVDFELKLNTQVTLVDGGHSATIEDLIAEGQGQEDYKVKCQCPAQPDSASGSAFVRVLADGRAFLQCSSQRHGHNKGETPQNRFWLNKKEKPKKIRAFATAAERKELLAEVPDELITYIETRISYSTPQAVYYWRDNGCWSVTNPWRKEGLFAHLDGLLEGNLGPYHVHAMISHVRSRQISGFTCDSARGAIVQTKRGRLLNLYAQPELTPQRAKWNRISRIISVLCDGDPKAIRWLMHWSAAIVQRPERRSMVAVLCLSPEQGIGKSMYGHIIEEVIGPRNVATIKDKDLRDNDNASFVTKLLVIADEVGVAGRADGTVISALKTYITDDSISCRALYASPLKTENRMSWWMTSNNPQPLVLEKTDRRFTVLRPSKTTLEYRRMLEDCFDKSQGKHSRSFAQEIEGFAYALHKMEVDYNLIAKPLWTPARQRLQKLSVPPHEAFAEEIATFGPAYILSHYPPPPEYLRIGGEIAIQGVVPCLLLYGSFRSWVLQRSKRRPVSEVEFRHVMEELPGVSVKSHTVAGDPIDCYVGLAIPKAKQEENNVISLHPDQ